MPEKKTNKKNARKDMKLDQLNQINIMDSKTKDKKVPAQENNGASMQNETRETREILIKTLKEIFQFDKNDLDFGIYRILNIKRREIKRFIEKDLFEIISSEIKIFDNSNDLSKKLSDLQNEIETTFGCGIEEALNNNPRAPKVLEYMRIKSELEQKGNKVELEEEIFDHLINFFSRYYDNGDFISKRRYSGENSYVIPYNGEEIYLYWANHDQYYIKTAENFRNYSFKAGDWSINFEIAEEDVSIEKANIKDPEKKYFIYHDLKVVGNNVNIYFGYRGLTEDEKKQILSELKKKTITRENVNRYNLNKIRENLLISPIKELNKKHERLDGTISNRTELEWHLDKYTTKNTSDYFIHKNLKGFLSRELDFYIKNEILDIDKISSEMDLKRNLKLIKVFKGIALRIIDFLSQIEEFQKRLWEKKKFVLSTDYLITLDYIDEKYYPEILKNTKQIEEWKRLNLISNKKIFNKRKNIKTLDSFGQQKEEINIAYLKSHPTLMINTKNFDIEWKFKILSEINNLEKKINGHLISSDNFHALNLLLNKYKHKVKCCYIDPPYNTVHSKILYKNSFEHSSWLTLLNNSIPISKILLSDRSSFGFAIDDYELPRALLYLEQTFFNFDISVVIINHHPQGSGGKLSRTHEYYIICSTREFGPLLGRVKDTYKEDRVFMRSGTGENNFRYGRWRSFYALLYDPKSKKIIDAEEPVPLNAPYPTEDVNGLKRIYPINSRKEERVWRSSYEKGKERARNGELFLSSSGTVYQSIIHENKRQVLFSNWLDSKFNAGQYGSELLVQLGLKREFDYPKSIYTIEQGIIAQTEAEKDAIIIDFFAGSGTTAHAIINLNKEDKGDRKFILVEMGHHFDSIIIPRIVKVIYSKNWKEGIPQDNNGSRKQIIKYQYLEQYEDSLQNIVFKKANSLLDNSKDYVLKYMLDFESKDSPVFLNIDMLDNPFDYKLKIMTENGLKTQKVDLIETFNYIAGIFVDSIVKKKKGDIDYVIVKGYREEKRVIVIWRNKPESFDPREDKEFVEKEIIKGEEFDEIFVNGNSLINNAVALDEIFKKGMFVW